MKTVSLRELHSDTGRIVRETVLESVVVTDHNRAIALITPYRASEIVGKSFPNRTERLKKKRYILVDSAEAIHEIRGKR